MTLSDGRVDADFVDLLVNGRDEAVLVVERPSRVIRACNDAVARVLGYRPAELIGRSTEILHLDHEHFVEFGEIVDSEIAQGRPFHRRYDVRHRDGRAIDAMYLVVPVIDNSGGVTASVSIVRDIGGAEANRRLLDLIVNEIPVSIAVTRIADGCVLLANRACREIFGLSATDGRVNRQAFDFYADPNDRQRVVAAVLRDGAVNGFDVQMRRKDGRLFWASMSMRLIRFGGEEAIFGTLVDVTAERDAHEAERKTRRLLESIVDNAPAHIYLKDLDSRFLLVNRTLRERLRAFVDDPIGAPSFVHFPPEVAARFARQDADVVRTRSVVENEVDVAAPGEDARIYRVTKFPVFDDDGAVAGIGGISIEITAERAAREAERKTRRLLESIVDNAPTHIYLKDLEGRYLLANRTLRDRLANAFDDPVGEMAYSRFPPEDAAKLARQDNEVVRTRASVQDEVTITPIGEAPRTRRITKFPVFDDQGNVTAIGGISLDVTAERQARDSEQIARRQLEAIVDNAPLHIFLKDRDRQYILINRALREERSRAGIAPHERGSYTRHPPEIGAKFAKQDDDVLRNGSIIVDEVTTTLQGIGCTRTLRVTKFPVLDEQGAVVAIGGISLDITEQRALEQRLRRAQKAEAIGKLTGGIAHDFNNLLTVVLGNAELLVGDLAADPAKRRMAERIESAARRAAALTERLLAFSRQQDLHPGLVDCGALIDGVTTLLQRTIGEHVDIVAGIDPGLWPVWVDRGQLENCLINLLVNARDAMPSGGTIRIGAENVVLAAGDMPGDTDLPPGAYVRLSVSDSGTGMTPEVQDRAFDPFFTTKDVGKGTGLGLSMAYGFVTQSGGQIAIRSKPGQGTVVIVDLPKAAADAAPAAVSARTEAAEVPTGHEAVLVVEDEPQVRAFVADELRRLGYDVIEAQDGQAALAALRARTGIALLLTDMVMPGGQRGNELARAARAIAPDLKVIFTTGYANAFDGKALPGDDGIPVLRKPYPRRELAEYVRRCLDARG